MKNLEHIRFNPLVVGAGLLALPTFSLLISGLIFLCGLSINPFIFPLAIVGSIALMYFISEKKHSVFFASTAYTLFFVVLSIIVSAIFYDYSYDGLAYHQEIILLLKNGWNPIYDVHPANAYFIDIVAHYAKGMGTISATIFSTTGNIEAGKAVNFILAFASAFLFFSFFKKCYETLSFAKKVLLTVLFTLCPIVIVQIWTFYIDGAGYSMLLILVTSLICFLRGRSKYDIYIICLIVFLSIPVKFNLTFWVVFAISCYLVYLVVTKKYQLFKKLIIACVVSGTLSVLTAGFNPYITNIRDHHTPFYPLHKELRGGDEIIYGQTPLILFDRSRLERVTISLLSFPNNCPHPQRKTQLANPLSFRPAHLGTRYAPVDMRIGGFGTFFAWILVLSGALYIAVSKRKNRLEYDVFLTILFIALLILPHGWWARFVPFFYVFPLVILLYSELENRNKFIRNFRNLIYLMLIANIFLLCIAVPKYAQRRKAEVDHVLEVLSKSKEPVLVNIGNNIGFGIKLQKRNIPHQKTREQLGTSVHIGPTVYFDCEKYLVENNILVERKP